MASLIISLTVNALVTGLSVFKIFMVSWETRPTSEERNLGIGRPDRKLQSIIFLIIESAMAIITVQLIHIATLRRGAVYFTVAVYLEMFMVIIELVIFILHFYQNYSRD